MSGDGGEREGTWRTERNYSFVITHYYSDEIKEYAMDSACIK